MSSLDSWLIRQLASVDAKHLRRHLRVVDSPQDQRVWSGGSELINFSSNDYLGLASDDRLREAALRAVDEWGVGSGASRLISGTLRPHHLLEQRIASFKRTEAALSFSSGFATAHGVIPALVGAGDVVILDKLSHACIVDAARASGATLRVFPHNDMNVLERQLRWARDRDEAGHILVATESVFSMDGDLAPLAELVDLKDRFGAWLFLDEAHAVGVLGPEGRGLAEATQLSARIEVQMGTLGKALGCAGGYICGSQVLVDFLVNKARSFVFSTAPSPVVAAAASEAVALLERGEFNDRIDRLWTNIRHLDAEAGSAIIPVPVGDENAAVQKSEMLRAAGFWVPAVRYPTVARGKARLRCTISASHRREDIAKLHEILSTTDDPPCENRCTGPGE